MITATKNPYAKTVAKPYKDNAYEIWQDTGFGEWHWYVLKSYQTDNSKPYARAFCLVTSPFAGDSGDLGDVYWADIRSNAHRIK